MLGHNVVEPLHAAEVDLHFADYSRAISLAGGMAVGLSRDAPVEAMLRRIDGLVLTGGADVNPTRYGEVPSAECGAIEDERDEWEIALVNEALRGGVPVYGICRGIQLLNVARGGTLVQDIGSSSGDRHDRYEVAREETVHAVRMVRGTLAHEVFGGELRVNSLHHQAVDEVGAGLVASGHSPDGTIEVLEMPGAKVLGVEWHPEMLLRAQPDPGLSWLVAEAGRAR